jgi:hypothetical protein
MPPIWAEKTLAETGECASVLLWAQLLGDNDAGSVFELPAHCAADGSKRTAATLIRTPGATRVPAVTPEPMPA